MNLAFSNLDQETFEARLLRACPQEKIEQLARTHHVWQRSWRKISPLALVYGFCRGTLSASSSMNRIAAIIATFTGRLVSKQALAKRISDHTVVFFQELLKIVIAFPLQIDPQQIDALLRFFANIWVVDSTVITVNPSFIDFFPGARNQSQKQSAALKIQLAYNLLSGLLSCLSISPYTRNDQAASADILAIARKGDLVIRDLGYFSLDVFAEMITANIYFITRILYNTTIRSLDRVPVKLLNLLKLLKQQPDGVLDQELLLGATHQLKLRIIAIPLPSEEAKKRRRKAKNDQQARTNHSPEYYQLLGWTILVTNIPAEVLSADMIHATYRLRWKIEIIFKLWKSFFCITQLPSKSLPYLQCVIYAKLILIVLANHLQIEHTNKVYRDSGQQLSPMKFAQFIASSIIAFFAPIRCRKWTFTPDRFIGYYCSYDKRKRKTMAQWIAELIPVQARS